MVLRLSVCQYMYVAVLPGPFQAFRPVQPERFDNILKSMAPFEAFLKETFLDLTFFKLYIFIFFFFSQQHNFSAGLA
jgi:hypothetical protein